MKNNTLNRCLTIITVCLLAFCSNSLFAAHLSNSLQMTARMNGANEVPAVMTDGQGIGIFTMNSEKDAVTINISMNNLSGDVMGIHIHEAAAGSTGGVVFDLTPMLSGNIVKGMLRGLTTEQVSNFLSGAYYVNAHTAMNPDGEIRAQIILESDFRYTASLDGTQEVPSVMTDAEGLGIFNLSKSGYKLEIKVVVSGLSGPITGAHLHNAAAGSNGGVVENLTTSVLGNVITANVDPTAYLAELRAGNIYLNIHTLANPDGEIRGQLVLEEALYFDAFINGAQASVSTLAEGVAKINITNTLDAIEFMVMTDGLSGSITAAHFHMGTVGNAGGVLLDLSSGIDGNKIVGTLTGLDVETINQFLSGGVYLNIHTDANPDGEIRGQVYRLAREGYSYVFGGGQEVPATTSGGKGAGMVTIDRDQTNAHFMMVVSDLTATIDAAHFHEGKPGENGGVLFDLSSFFNNGGAYGYWTEQNTTPFMASPMFREDNVYVNIHTATFPSGEIRANVTRGSNFFQELPIDPRFSSELLFATKLTGANEVPSVTTDAIGVASFLLNENRDAISVNVSTNGLSGDITGIHIHKAAAGSNGDVVFDLTSAIQDNRVSMELTGFNNTQLADMFSGQYYLNVHTAANPGGEIRGQIALEADVTYRADLDGMQSTPAGSPTAIGLATFNYTNVVNQLEINVLVSGLSGNINAAHLHVGAPGMAGGVVEDLSPFIHENHIEGIVFPSGYLEDLKAGNIYINIHTDAYPDGEIRGQLTKSNDLIFDTWLNGIQQAPPAINSSLGFAVVSISPTLDAISYRVIGTGLSGDITGSHFHNAPLGMSGGVVLDLTGGINGNEISGMTSGTDVSADLVNMLLRGETYINVHTAGFAGGEMRGQLFRLARDGYGYDICPEQETAMVDAINATGAGMASIDRKLSNAHVMIVSSGLTGDLMGAHIHQAEAGVDGDVIYDLSPMFNNGGMFTYWSDMSTTPFTSTIAKDLQDEMLYVNIHTAANPSGEIRGQIIRDVSCTFTTSADYVTIGEGNMQIENVFPTPASTVVNILFENDMSSDVELAVFDITGKLVMTKQFFAYENQTQLEQINVAKWAAGTYLIRITNDRQSVTAKLTK